MSTVLIACGGTGGHLAPGIAIAEELQERGCRAILLISRKQVDSALIGKYRHLDFHKAPGRAFSGGLAGKCFALLDVFNGLLFSRRLIRQHRPSAVLLFGGFLSLGLGLAARLRGIPLALHEANRQPGRAVRLLKPLATRVYLPEGVHLDFAPERIRYCGYPVRREIRPQPHESARRNLGIEPSGKLLVVIGGSQGAEALNLWVREHFAKLSEAGISVYCVAGLGKAAGETVVRKAPDGRSITATFVAFSDQMSDVLSAADLVVTRAGAGAIAEIIRCRVPAILVPYPYAADDHQMANALAHEKAGAGMVVSQDRIDALLDAVLSLVPDDSRLAAMRADLERLGGMDAARCTADDILELGGMPEKEAVQR